MATLSRTPSPASGSDSDSVVATPMTPRSKLRALYATIDGGDSSDSESEKDTRGEEKDATSNRKANSGAVRPNAPIYSRLGSPTGPRTLAEADAAVLGASSPGLRQAIGEVSIDSDDDDVVPVGPRGRFAARMLDEPTKQPVPPLADNARDRVKRMLEQAAQAEKQASTENDNEDNGNDAEDEDDDDIRAISRPRKLTNRALRRSASPREASPAMFMSPMKPADREDSPDMFVTPTKGGAVSIDEVSSATNPGRTARFQALVAKKREEARKREEEEQRKRAARAARQAEAEEDDSDDDDLLMRDDADDAVSDITDDDGGRKLTQDVRPARKASRKALEEMHRETQRMSRNLQLAHEAKTKKKITKASLFERFNFKPEGAATATAAAAVAATTAAATAATPVISSRPTSPASPRNDVDGDETDTPPSSPPIVLASEPLPKATTPPARPDKGKGKAIAMEETTVAKPKRQVRVRLPIQATTVLIDSDSDGLEIVQSAKNRLDILFDNAPLKREKEHRSMQALRRLAQIGSPDKKRKQKETNDLTLGELQQNLQDRARHQAKLERNDRLERLRAKGIRVQTEEEREKEMAEVDDIVARARLEAEEIMQREKEAAKQAKKERKGGADDDDSEADLLDWDESEDEDGEDFVPEEEKDIELSGSEDEDEVDDVDAMDETVEGVLIDDAAESADETAEESGDEKPADSDNEATEALPTSMRVRPAKRRNAVLTSDDEDEDAALPRIPALTEAKTPAPKATFAKSPSGPNTNSDSPQVPTSVLRSATKSFIPGLPIALGKPAGLGLTQIFAGTMADDSQFAGSASGFGSPLQFMPTIGNFAEPNLPQDGAKADTGEQDIIRSSQPTQDWVKQVQEGGYTGSQAVKLDFSQTQAHGLGSLLRDADASQFSGFMESQDMASQEYSPLKVRFIEHQASTVETVVLERTQAASLGVLQPQPETLVQSSLPHRKKGKLFRKPDVAKADEEGEVANGNGAEATGDIEATAAANSAFSVMKDAAATRTKQAAAKAFDRKKSKAKDLVEEQAEESEDEYAGLGGADGEDSDNESLASVKDLIDDDQKVTEADNAKLAAFYADREREQDEKQVEKLFRDVTTGMLRRKRGADYDLSDSDDDGEARRRMKRRQFARMQKALFSDERISKVAENPRNQAFLKTIEDRGSDDEMDFIFDHAASAASTTGSAASATAAAEATTAGSKIVIPDSQPGAEPASVSERRAKRRQQSASGRKPSNLGEIRESLSSLLEDGTSMSVVADTEFGSDEENDGTHEDVLPGSSKESRQPDSWKRRNNVHVVDRISLQRGNSGGHATVGRTAFNSGLGGGPMGPTGFKAPALLRRATTNSLLSTTSSRSSSSGGGGGDGNGGGFADQGKIKKNASKQSGINYFARENERRAAMAEGDKRRQAKKVRSAEGRSRVVGGLFGAGKFE